MKKDFQKWHKKKEFLHEEKIRPFFDVGEVWFCSLGANVGYEQDGAGRDFLRPVVIIKKFNQEIFWGLPLTKKPKKGKYYFSFKIKETTSVVILSQVRLIDGKRLQYKIGEITERDLLEMRKRLTQLLA